jgi:hypothetical protein
MWEAALGSELLLAGWVWDGKREESWQPVEAWCAGVTYTAGLRWWGN